MLTRHLSLKNWRRHMPGCLCQAPLADDTGRNPPYTHSGGCGSPVPRLQKKRVCAPGSSSPRCLSQRGQGRLSVPGNVAETLCVCSDNSMHTGTQNTGLPPSPRPRWLQLLPGPALGAATSRTGAPWLRPSPSRSGVAAGLLLPRSPSRSVVQVGRSSFLLRSLFFPL